MTRRDSIGLLAVLDDPNVQAFLAAIRAGEGTPDARGYYRLFGGAEVNSLAAHPRRVVTAKLGATTISSTAAGAYQFLARTWDGLVRQYGFSDFEPRTQDIAALALIDARRALDDVLAGRFESAVAKCAREWASLPGSPYGQPTKTMGQARAVYMAAGGVFEAASAPTTPQPVPQTAAALDPELAPALQEDPMPIAPIIAAVLPSVIEAIPRLGKLFGSGSEVAERNVRAAEIAVGIVKEAVGARNEQEAADLVKSDPALAKAAREAVESRWFELAEVGGGVEAARKADQVAMTGDGPWWSFLRSPSFWALLLLLPLVYLIVLSIIGVLGPVQWSDDVRSALAGTIVGTIVGGAVGYYWGQTTSRNRAPIAAP